MKQYSYRFSNHLLVLMYLAIALSCFCIGLDVYWIVTDGFTNYYVGMRYVLFLIIAIAIIVIIVTMLKKSYYTIENGKLYTVFGIIKSEYDLSLVAKISFFRAKKQLSLIFQDESFAYLWVKTEWFDEFLSELLKACGEVEFEVCEEAPENKEDNKNEHNDR